MRCDWNLATTLFEIVLEYFRGDAIGIWLRQILRLSQNNFAELKWDLEIFCPGEEKRRIGLRNFLSKKEKGRKGVGLKRICPSKSEKESKVKQVRKGLRSPVR